MNQKLPLTTAPDSLCILRLSALGDVTHVVPVVRAIQSHWPTTKITWVCGAFESKLLANLENVRFVTFNKSAGVKEYRALWQSLRDTHFDVLLHMQVSARANIASLGIRAKIKLGWDSTRARDMHSLCINARVPFVKQQHQVLGFLSFAQTLGIPVTEPSWQFPVDERAQGFVDQHLDNNRRTLIISPSSSHTLRNWTIEGYAAVADHAMQCHNMQVILCGGPSASEVSLAQLITDATTGELINLTGKDTLQQLIALIDACDVVLSPDSGPLHLANALGKPVIGLYACTWSRRSGPFDSLHYCVDHFEQAAQDIMGASASSLRWGKRIERDGVMQMISVAEVTDKLDEVMKSLPALSMDAIPTPK